MSSSFNSSDDVFVPNINDINDEIDEPENSRKTASIWKYVNCKDPSHPGVPVCKTCGFVFSIKSGNSNPWLEKEKSEQDDVVVTWIIGD
ncbi:hypothetical protein RCL_jg19387.t1 [Rhizophagus clarus]|uniref:Uncharacterized protein n=1 Tax=Rhizophagus clarus TaxID=94130 RepID=A0A8H3QXL9_9GLOM|nr:hypothetical protein RCL_jg19387.t1 [Rhizophagus clarus]